MAPAQARRSGFVTLPWRRHVIRVWGGVAGEARVRPAPERSGLSDQHALALKGKPVGMNALVGQTLGFELIGISLIGNLLLGR